jgi:hypothetical protein
VTELKKIHALSRADVSQHPEAAVEQSQVKTGSTSVVATDGGTVDNSHHIDGGMNRHLLQPLGLNDRQHDEKKEAE